MIEYLRGYAADLRADIRTGHRVAAVHQQRRGFAVETDDAQVFVAPVVIAATGGFGNPYRPALPGLNTFTGTLLHASAYREPSRFAGQRIVIVGAGNTAVQIGVELAGYARVTLATRARQVRAATTVGAGYARLARSHRCPARRAPPAYRADPVFDTGAYRSAITSRQAERRELFTAIDGTVVSWADGTREYVDTSILATGYRPDVSYLAPLGALDQHGRPRQSRGLPTTHPARRLQPATS